jgi:hypothetical protein
MMAVLFLNAMALVKRFGPPDLFITVTCNPNHPDLAASQADMGVASTAEATDQPGLIARFFALQVRKLLDVIQKGGAFGPIEMYTGVIEFQKRNLPHLHLLVRLADGPRSGDPSAYDEYVSWDDARDDFEDDDVFE